MPDTIDVPNLIGLTQSAAEEKLKEADLTVGNVKTMSSATTASGNVSSANPAAGTPVSLRSAVNLEVSSGPALVKVPDVEGLTRPAAEAELKVKVPDVEGLTRPVAEAELKKVGLVGRCRENAAQ